VYIALKNIDNPHQHLLSVSVCSWTCTFKDHWKLSLSPYVWLV